MENTIIHLADFHQPIEKTPQKEDHQSADNISPQLAEAIQELIQKLRNNQPI